MMAVVRAGRDSRSPEAASFNRTQNKDFARSVHTPGLSHRAHA